MGLSRWLSGIESACQCRRHRFNPLGQEDLLEKEMATHSRILAWEIPWTEEPGGLQSMGLQRVGYNLAMKQQLVHYIRNSLCCLENNTGISQPFAIENNTWELLKTDNLRERTMRYPLPLPFLLASHAAAANSWGLWDTTLREVSVFTWTVIKTINWLSNFCNGLEIY